MKRKNLLLQYSNYKEFFRKAIFDIAHNEIYKFWIAETKETVLKNLKHYEENKIYTSNIVDPFFSSLATVCKATIITYYITDDTVQNHLFTPLKNESTVVIEVCFVNGHYDLVIQKEVNFAIKTEDSSPMTFRKPTADISNVKIEDIDIFHEGLNKAPLPPECICISSESSQEDAVSADEDM